MEMKALIITKPGTAIVKSVPVPAFGENDIRIKIKASGICGTDVHIFKGEYLGSYPVIPGHEFSGIVDDIGSNVTRFKIGDHVAVEPNIACDNCSACLNNRQNFCDNWEAVGVTRPGGMAEYTVVPEKSAFSIGDLPFNYGAFVEPLSCVLHGVERAGIKLGDKVLIIGAGPIGILLSMVIQLQGTSEITQVDKNTHRLEFAKKNGAAHTLTSLDDVPKEAFDVVVDATGVSFVMEKTIEYARKSGTILLFGAPKKDAEMTVPLFTIFEKELTIKTSYTSVRNSIQAIRLLESGKIDLSLMVSHQLPLEDFVTGIKTIDQGMEEVLKIMILP